MLSISRLPDLLSRANEYFDNRIGSHETGWWRSVKKGFYYLDIASAFLIHGSTLNDYIRYEFYKKRFYERATFVTARRQRHLFNINKPKYRLILDDKCKMHQIYGDFLGREWIYPRDVSFSQFVRFCKVHSAFVVKPRFGAGGEGIYTETLEDPSQMESLYRYFQDKDLILDEVITQHSTLERLHPSSVNTLRVNTLCVKDKLDIVSIALRMGNNGSTVDNRASGGLFAGVDASSGVVTTTAVDGDFNRHVFHPLSAQQIVGLQIPFWEEVIEFVNRAFKVYPKCPYIGWDIAITPSGPVLVEANGRALVPVQQQADQVGKWPFYKQYLETFNE